MGVPGFFIWLWKKYQNSSQKFISDESLENIQDLFIDANCLIHPQCFKILEENKNWQDIDDLEQKMINQIINYLDYIIEFVKPQRTIYIAIDGVAPVAKIKQQRLRRFKSSKDRYIFESIKRKHHKEITNFWTNASISPGTKFMEKITRGIQNYCKNCENIIFSSAQDPGEGEHKILQYIKQHQIDKCVIYGLDADLIFLALSSHQNNIYLLREKSNIKLLESNNIFNYVDIDIMKNKILEQMQQLIGDEINLEKNRIINDFIFLCYFLGNDFLPHLPSIDIGHYDKIMGNGLDILLEAYVTSFLNVNDYLIYHDDKITFNKTFLTYLLNNLAIYEDSFFVKQYHHHKKIVSNSKDPYEREIFKINNLQFKFNDPIELGKDEPILWKYRYYKEYFHCTLNQKNFVKDLCHHYFTGLLWVAEYYFNKCPAWEWYFPYDHGPFLSDLVNNLRSFKFESINFNLGEPLDPLTQLLCILPRDYNYLIPKSNRHLMSESSPLAHLYPINYQLDYCYKRFYWQCNPILPSLDIDLVKKYT